MPPQGQRGVAAFTGSCTALSRVLVSEVRIGEAFDPNSQQPPKQPLFKAIWDTGATNSAITQNVIDQCGLKATGMAVVHTAQAITTTETFLVSILLPNNVGFPSVKVSRAVLRDYDVLIGMDIIGRGDFAVTNKDGKTVFSYRWPSMECIDFAKQLQHPTPVIPAKVGRNDPCPCGSGRKYKKCCLAAQRS
jgi:predicted aspartyl protease